MLVQGDETNQTKLKEAHPLRQVDVSRDQLSASQDILFNYRELLATNRLERNLKLERLWVA